MAMASGLTYEAMKRVQLGLGDVSSQNDRVDPTDRAREGHARGSLRHDEKASAEAIIRRGDPLRRLSSALLRRGTSEGRPPRRSSVCRSCKHVVDCSQAKPDRAALRPLGGWRVSSPVWLLQLIAGDPVDLVEPGPVGVHHP